MAEPLEQRHVAFRRGRLVRFVEHRVGGELAAPRLGEPQHHPVPAGPHHHPHRGLLLQLARLRALQVDHPLRVVAPGQRRGVRRVAQGAGGSGGVHRQHLGAVHPRGAGKRLPAAEVERQLLVARAVQVGAQEAHRIPRATGRGEHQEVLRHPQQPLCGGVVHLGVGAAVQLRVAVPGPMRRVEPPGEGIRQQRGAGLPALGRAFGQGGAGPPERAVREGELGPGGVGAVRRRPAQLGAGGVTLGQVLEAPRLGADQLRRRRVAEVAPAVVHRGLQAALPVPVQRDAGGRRGDARLTREAAAGKAGAHPLAARAVAPPVHLDGALLRRSRAGDFREVVLQHGGALAAAAAEHDQGALVRLHGEADPGAAARQ